MSDDDLLAEMRSTVTDFLSRESGREARRAAMDSDHGYSGVVFRRAMTELGLGGLAVPEALGGAGLGFAEVAVAVEEFGRALVPSPLLDTLVAATVLAELPGDVPARETVLRQLVDGSAAIAVCGLTPGHGDAPVAADGGRLSGVAGRVPFGAAADLLLVVGDDGMYLVPASDTAVTRAPCRALDHTRRLATIELNGVALDGVSGSRLAVGGDSATTTLLDRYRVALAAESAAAAQACLDETVSYLTVREQFGRAIGSFQALKHRCADLAVEVAGARATAGHAVALVASGELTDELGDDLPTVAAMAKVVCTDTLMLVAADCLQLHGGVGFTFEHDMHLYLKRAKANQLLAGTGPRLRRYLAAHLQ